MKMATVFRELGFASGQAAGPVCTQVTRHVCVYTCHIYNTLLD